MKRVHAGSAILTVVITITLIMIIAGTIFRSATLFYDFALQRVANERHLRALQALMEYGIAWCTVIDAYKIKDPSYEKTFDSWPPSIGLACGHIAIVCHPKSYTVTAQLKKGSVEWGSSSCRVSKKDRWVIEIDQGPNGP